MLFRAVGIHQCDISRFCVSQVFQRWLQELMAIMLAIGVVVWDELGWQ